MGLSIFLVIAAFTINQFWRETDRNLKMLEAMHFSKNMAILTELVYIATGLLPISSREIKQPIHSIAKSFPGRLAISRVWSAAQHL